MCACILPSPSRGPICYEILDPLGSVRLEGGVYISEYKLAFLEMAWDMGYLTHPYFMTPQSHGSSPYKIVYGRSLLIIRQVSTNLPQVRGDEISQQMEQLGKVINQITKFVQERVPFPLGEQIHEFVPRDQVWSRTRNMTPWPHIGRVHILLF